MKEVASVSHVGPQFPDRFWRDDAAECDAGDLRVKAWSGEFDRGSVMLIRYARSSSSFCAKWQTGHRFGTPSYRPFQRISSWSPSVHPHRLNGEMVRSTIALSGWSAVIPERPSVVLSRCIRTSSQSCSEAHFTR